jgi:hypothetical protein
MTAGVTPAKAGVHEHDGASLEIWCSWIPAFAGMTVELGEK